MDVSPASVAAPPVVETRWIISRRDDLTWFVGPAAIGCAALALLAAGFPFALLYMFWAFGVDGPHVWATVTRTYLDPEARGRLGWWLWIGVPFLGLGLAAVWAGMAGWYFLFAVCWQHFHIAKQHYGFIMLWKAKNGDRDKVDFRLDRYFLMASLWVPLAGFVVATRPVIARLPGVELLVGAARPAFLVFVAAYIARQVWKWRCGKTLNWPKLLLLGVVVPLQWVAFAYAAGFGPTGIVRAGIALGLFHSFQYHRLLWFHNRNRYSVPNASSRFGLASVVARKFHYYLLLAIGLQFVANGYLFFTAQAEWMIAAGWSVAFTHYVLDAKIWHVREDRELAAALGMARPA